MEPTSQQLNNRNLAVSGKPNTRSLSQFSGEVGATSPALSKLNDKIISSLSKSISGAEGQEQSIMDKFAERRRLAGEGAEASRELITSRAGTDIAEAREAGEERALGARRAQIGLGADSSQIQAITQQTEKNIRSLKKDRDELLLLGKVAEAERMDNLIFEEQKSITTARKTLLDNLLKGSAEIRAQSAEGRAVGAEARAVGAEARAEESLQIEKDRLAESIRSNQLRDDLSRERFEEEKRQFGVSHALKQSEIRAEAAEKVAEKSEEEQASVSSALGNLSLIDKILDSENLSLVTGRGRSISGFGKGNQLVKNQIDQLTAILALDNREKLKGQGTISDFEAGMLQKAASAFGDDPRALGDDDFRQVMTEIRGVFANAAGLDATVIITNPQTGEEKMVRATRDGIEDALLSGFRVNYTEDVQPVVQDGSGANGGGSKRKASTGFNFDFSNRGDLGVNARNLINPLLPDSAQ